MLLAPLGLLLVAAAYKSLQVRAAREWPSTPGKVVVSKAEVRKVKVIDSDRAEGHRFEERNFANIVYEYSVAGRKLRNNRVSIGEDRGNFQVAETIAKYPVGAVVTVYYNPLHPDQAVLERDLPKGMWGCLGIGTAIVLAIVFGSAIGLHQIDRIRIDASRESQSVAVRRRLGRVRTSDCAVRAGAAPPGFAGEEMAGRARHHQVVGHRTIPCRAVGRGRRSQIMYQRKVSYTYRYNGIDYASEHASLGEQRRVDLEAGWCANPPNEYQDGARVKVCVNPR